MKNIKISLERHIAEINNLYPPDDFIVSYKDFLAKKHVLSFYKLNNVVLQNLLSITTDIWLKEIRVSRYNLILGIKQYVVNSKDNLQKLSHENKVLLSRLLMIVIDHANKLTPQQRIEALRLCNIALINIASDKVYVVWLCQNATKNQHVLNRLLRYPEKSDEIIDWVKEHWNTETGAVRRTEMVSWLLDAQTDYEISDHQMEVDFKAINLRDKRIKQRYIDSDKAEKLVNSEFGEFIRQFDINDLPPTKEPYLTDNRLFYPDPDETYTKRFYPVPQAEHSYFRHGEPDFEQLELQFIDNFKTTKKVLMIWAIAYSRHDKNTKCKMLEKYYGEDTIHSLIKVGRRFELIDFLEWLIQQQ